MRAMMLSALAATLALAGTAMGSQNLIGFNFTTAASGVPDPQNWNRLSAAAGTVPNVLDDTGAVTNVSVTYGGGATGGFVYLATNTLAPDAVPQYDYSLAGMTGYGFRSNGEFFIRLSGLAPNAPYEYWFVAYRATAAISNQVSVSNGDIINATVFMQSLSPNNGRFVVNTTNANDTMHFNDLSLTTMSSSTGEITFNWIGVGQTVVIGALAVRLVPTPSALALLGLGALVALRRRR